MVRECGRGHVLSGGVWRRQRGVWGSMEEGAPASTLAPNDRVLRLVLILPLYPLCTMV